MDSSWTETRYFWSTGTHVPQIGSLDLLWNWLVKSMHVHIYLIGLWQPGCTKIWTGWVTWGAMSIWCHKISLKLAAQAHFFTSLSNGNYKCNYHSFLEKYELVLLPSIIIKTSYSDNNSLGFYNVKVSEIYLKSRTSQHIYSNVGVSKSCTLNSTLYTIIRNWCYKLNF